MTVKQYLTQAYFTNEKIKDSLQELERLRMTAISVNAGHTSQERVSTSGIADIVGSRVPCIVDMEVEIEAKIRDYNNTKREIENTIEKIEDNRAKAVLLKRYIYFKDWDEISGELSYGVRQVYRLHKKGLEEIEKMSVNVSECHYEVCYNVFSQK